MLQLLAVILTFLPSQPNEAEILGNLDRALRSKDYPNAIKFADEAIKANPKSARNWFLRGVAQSNHGEHSKALESMNKVLELDDKYLDALDYRGSIHFKMGMMKEAGEDFDKFIKMRPEEYPGHWRRGIALYYLHRYKDGADQFNAYQKVDGNDVENGVWHYLCHARAENREKARAAMLPIGNDRRIPMMEVYSLFQGKSNPEKVMELAQKAPENQQKMAMFYAHLYLGLYHESQDEPKKAIEHMEQAAKLGPKDHYMGDVARVHWELLKKSWKP
jgi:lipoprotein NlpI